MCSNPEPVMWVVNKNIYGYLGTLFAVVNTYVRQYEYY